MKSRVVKAHSKEHVEVYNKRLGVVFNGDNNLKPLVIESLIDNSPTASQCAWLYESFLSGAGFEVDLDQYSVGSDFWEKETPNNILDDVTESLSKHSGVFVHIQYNALFEKESFSVLPYTKCRIGKKDSKGYSGKIVVSDTGWGRRVKKENLVTYHRYNPDPKIIQQQVEDAGCWENYTGQVYYFKLNNKKNKTYSKSLLEIAYIFADVEHKMGLFYNATVDRGFNDITVVRHKAFSNKNDEKAFDENAKSVMGVEGGSSLWMIEDDWESDSEKEGNVRFDKLKSDQKADRYKHFEESSSNYIRKAYRGAPPVLIDYIQGKLGNSSGDDIKPAEAVYNKRIAKDKKKVETFFTELFNNYKDNINPSNNWKIKQYSLLDDGTINTQE